MHTLFLTSSLQAPTYFHLLYVVIKHVWRHLSVIVRCCRLLDCFYKVTDILNNPKRRNVSAATQLAIVQLFDKDEAQAEIARLLELNKSFVSRVLLRHNECISVENRSRTGRPPLLSPGAKRDLFNDVKKSRNAPLQEITNIFNQGRARRVQTYCTASSSCWRLSTEGH